MNEKPDDFAPSLICIWRNLFEKSSHPEPSAH
jgi:hypothetical protein